MSISETDFNMNVMSAGLLGEIMAVQMMNEVDKPEKLINLWVNSRIIQQFNSLFEIIICYAD